MSIEERINVDIITALRARDSIKKGILVTIKGEIQTVKKNLRVETLSDMEIVKILNRFKKGLIENLKTVNTSNDQDQIELSIIEEYYPKMMNDDEILSKINSLIESGVVNIGGIMGSFKGLPVDMQRVSVLYQSIK